MRSGKDGWTEEALAALRSEWKAGTPVEAIAARLGRSVNAVRNAAARLCLQRGKASTASRTVNADTQIILDRWTAGVPVEVIAAEHGKTARSIQLLASYHKTRRPAWYLSAVRGGASAEQFKEMVA